MRTCLTHPTLGYYAKQDVFGAAGDFVTAPEVSQLFADSLAVYGIHALADHLAPAATTAAPAATPVLHYVELGPGRGTLASDLLRAAAKIAKLPQDSIHVHLVEASPFLSGSRPKRSVPATLRLRLRKVSRTEAAARRERAKRGSRETPSGPRATSGSERSAIASVAWYDSVRELEGAFADGAPIYVVANEFFDALPVHQLLRVDGAWRERLVGLDPSGDALTLTLSDAPTLACSMVVDDGSVPVVDGDGIEISPDSWAAAKELARVLAAAPAPAFAGAIIDYGWASPVPASLRAIKDHAVLTSFLDHPGDADLTADVDFGTLAKVLTASSDALAVAPLLDQGVALQKLGIAARTETLLAAGASADDIIPGVERLVAPDAMGSIYKALFFGSRNALPSL
ncbi:ATP synthase beta subunit/transcription termination factor rho [Thecamonas trahens ATCC 50062]|uniref:Protein arginine methyltransferase NDUFAF7 n=1 Tax=Thecamonas trahens ATCC 50062 TaxID=461836 RepID=A0A0L0D270_THETB|nr:ATP synthase beta subunit/transcription termination factor rho [Thecamonas trahens ATCC 50062]KNC46220.1 ATP synthase beta subunit/transcription termination factor rho [Thecamonas trahens ATCC 50062]|eukprot:XP_013760517.1 ATP synthase beta subunit/transcription termination factor rho [Thecamonas trahens ATCC 50062]